MGSARHDAHARGSPVNPLALHMKTDQTQGAILLRNTMAFNREHAGEFKQAVQDAVRFAEKNAPQLMVQVFVDDDRALCYSFQLYDSSEAVLRHWEVSDPHIVAVMKHCTVQSMEVYGSPSEAVRKGILDALGCDKVSFVAGLVGYHHLVPRQAAAVPA